MSKKRFLLAVLFYALFTLVACSGEPEEAAVRDQESAVDLDQAQELLPTEGPTKPSFPTYTPQPTCTPLPTYTPPPTYTPLPEDTPERRLSQPGVYQGYSSPLYPESTATSQYITMRDGTKLAALILRPAQDGKPVNTPLPVIWTHNRYHREGILHELPIIPSP